LCYFGYSDIERAKIAKMPEALAKGFLFLQLVPQISSTMKNSSFRKSPYSNPCASGQPSHWRASSDKEPCLQYNVLP
jgi:hypothetical protein